VRDGWGDEALAEATPGGFPGGATLRSHPIGWVLAEDRPERSLGGALAWAGHAGVEELRLLASSATGDLARRAAEFARPPKVWEIEGPAVRRAQAAALEPDAAVPDAALPLLDVVQAAGARPVGEHGVLTAEVLGLEVARVGVEGSNAWLEVGVGKHDREGQRLLHGDRSPLEALVAAVAEVRRLRVADATSHPANLLSPERWLRAVVLERPAVAGAGVLVPIASTVVRRDLRSRAPAPALGLGEDGAPVVVVCSVGIDPDLVPVAADVRAAARAGLVAPAPWIEHPWAGYPGGGRPGLVLVVPEGDDHAVTRELAAALVEPAAVRTVPGDWRRMVGADEAPSLP